MRELPSGNHIFNILSLDSWEVVKSLHIDLIVKMPNVADNGVVLHFFHIRNQKDIFVTSSSDKNVNFSNNLILGNNLVSFHAGLQSTNRVDLGNVNDRVLGFHGSGTTFTNISVSENDAFLSSEHNISGSVESIRERVSASVDVVEFGFSHRVVDVNAWALKFSSFF